MISFRSLISSDSTSILPVRGKLTGPKSRGDANNLRTEQFHALLSNGTEKLISESGGLMQRRKARMRFGTKAFLVLTLALSAPRAADAAALNGNSLALKSDGQSSGGAYVLDRNGLVGTYITLAAPASVKIDVAAEGTGGPAMGVFVGDSAATFAVGTGASTYSRTVNLPAGTHFIRTELNNDRDVAGRQLKVNSLTVTGNGVNFSNTHSSANALAASDTYIANYRKGNAAVKIQGVSAGQQVSVSLKRLGFDFGAGVHTSATDVKYLLGNQGTTRQQVYQRLLNQNFNTIATAGAGYWGGNEPTQGDVQMSGLNEFYDYADAHNMHARLHTALWEDNQPAWVESLTAQAVTDPAAKTSLTSAINSRINYYAGNPNSNFDEIDVYNESFNAGEKGGPETFWNLYGPGGVASIYQNAEQAAAAVGNTSKMFLNEYAVLQGSSNSFGRHIDSIRKAGVDAGYGETVGGIGLQLYTDNISPTMVTNMMYGLQNMNVRALPTVLTEFGTFLEVSPEDSATALGQAMRLMFGNPTSTGLLVWDWTQENGGVDQWATGSALYTVNTSDWNTTAITPAGKVWQDLRGIQDWDGNPNNGWNTQLTAVAGPDGTINFNGFYGDYELTVGGQTYDLALTKGVTNYVIGDAIEVAGDFNGDGEVDAVDYTVWRDHRGTNFNLSGNGNESGASAGVVDQADYTLWKTGFGHSAGSGSATALQIPEPAAFHLAAFAILFLGRRSLRQQPKPR